jgi:Protein of unknown function (DUF3102)
MDVPSIAPREQRDKPSHASSLLAQHADMIRQQHRRALVSIIEIGRLLRECKKLLVHGEWLPWLQREFSWSERTARNYIAIHECFAAKSANVADLSLDLTTLYLLAAPSTPPEVRDEVIERARAGEMLSRQQVQRIVRQAKPQPPASAQPKPSVTVEETMERTGRKPLRRLSRIESSIWFEIAKREGEEIANEWAESRAKLKKNYRDLLLGLEFQEMAAKSPIRKLIAAIPPEQRSTTAERLRVAAELLLKLRARLAET